jgi:hypothetical protein
MKVESETRLQTHPLSAYLQIEIKEEDHASVTCSVSEGEDKVKYAFIQLLCYRLMHM